MAIDKALYTAHATSTGGRTGTTESSDGVIKLALTTPRELGGAGGNGTNPEQLFASGYSACFIGAMKAVAGSMKTKVPDDVSITSDVGIGPIPNGFGIQVAMRISLPGMERSAAEALVAALECGRIELSREANAPREAHLLALDSSKARMRLGWRPRLDFAATIDLTATWYSAWARGESMAALTKAQIAAYMESGT